MTEKEMREWADKATYEELLTKIRFEPIGSPWFQGETGDYIYEKFKEKHREIGNEEGVEISKRVGWGD